MKNIHEILKEIGIEIPEDKKASFNTAVNENYKTVAEIFRQPVLLPFVHFGERVRCVAAVLLLTEQIGH